MRKSVLYKLFYILSVILATAFCVIVAIDSYNYSHSFDSAPFYVSVFSRAVILLPPSLAAFAAGAVIHKKSK